MLAFTSPAVAQSPKEKVTTSTSTEPLFYTIQIATYNNPTDALPLYKLIKQKLAEDTGQTFLRIAKVSGYSVIRSGKANARQNLGDALVKIKILVPDAHIMRAYYRTSRIIFPKTTPANKQNIRKAQTKQPKKEAEHVTQKSLTSSTLPVTIPPPPPVVLSPKPDSEEILTALMNKYLSEGRTSTINARQYAQQATKKITATPNCLTANCHAKLVTVKIPHMPVEEAKCAGCHKQTSKQHPSGSKGDFKLLDSGKALCLKCHMDITSGKVVHSPAQEGKCLICHNPHGTNNKNLLAFPPDDQKKLCQTCHESKGISDFKFMHGPVDLGACTFCHNPHSAAEAGLLRRPPRELCQTCHEAIKNEMANMPNIHSPVKTQGCLACHLPHGSQFPQLLKKESEELCFTCHEDIRDKLEHSKTKHAGLYLDKKCGTCHTSHYSKFNNLLIKPEMELCLTCHQSNSPVSGFRPKDIADELKDKEYLHGPIADKNCSGCHSPHGSDYPMLLTEQTPDSLYAPYTGPAEYALCFSCHDQQLLSEAETTDSTKFRNGTHNLHNLHVAKEHKGRTCKACHQSHASDGPKLISRNGAEFGTWHISIDFKLNETGGSCTPSCHRSMSYDRQDPKDNSAENRKYGKYYVDYKSNR